VEEKVEEEKKELEENETMLEEEEEVEVEEIEYDGVNYFRSASGVVYDMITSEEVGRWNEMTKSIEVE
jgi:hypothetical protein